MRARLGVVGLVAAALLPGAWAPSGAAGGPAVRAVAPAAAAAGPFEEGDWLDCLVGAGPTDPSPAGGLLGGRVRLDVAVFLDGVDPATAQAALDVANEVYAPLRLDLVPRFAELPLGSHGERPGRPGTATVSTDAAFAALKVATGGSRPSGVDLVYLMTAKDLYSVNGSTSSVEGDRSYGVAGQADCIGGVRWGGSAFAIGEARADGAPWMGLVSLDADRTGRILAHELGHLLGAHHHYGNCAEGDVVRAAGSTSVCTVMLNDLSLVGYRFSSVNGAIVRGEAERYAAP